MEREDKFKQLCVDIEPQKGNNLDRVIKKLQIANSCHIILQQIFPNTIKQFITFKH